MESSKSQGFFDALMKAHEFVRYYLAADSQIVVQEVRDFENGIVKFINKEDLTTSEKIAMKPFQSDTVYRSSSVDDFAEEVLKAKKEIIEKSDFNDNSWFPATSNSCQRLFSIAKQTAPRFSIFANLCRSAGFFLQGSAKIVALNLEDPYRSVRSLRKCADFL